MVVSKMVVKIAIFLPIIFWQGGGTHENISLFHLLFYKFIKKRDDAITVFIAMLYQGRR